VSAALCVLATLTPRSAAAQRLVELQYVPAPRAQIAIWLERADGTFVTTLRLTEATAYRGIGNRPGATQMNSGFRWPYGRRESVLPVWAHRRLAGGGAPFRRVIFQDRRSEGFASRTSNDSTADGYFCLSFDDRTTRRDALDAVACASLFLSDKGRYLTETDLARGYAEPRDDGTMMPLTASSPYPPRRDVARCGGAGTSCPDHADVASFAADARAAMPEIDAVTMATAAGGEPVSLVLPMPDGLRDGDYRVLVEVNVEGDYNTHWNDTTQPTPTAPADMWDYWAIAYGYAYRGQPSVVYAVPVRLGWTGESAVEVPIGRGSPTGQGPDGGRLFPVDATMSDDPVALRGSGVDRLQRGSRGHRLRALYLGPRGPDPGGPLPCLDDDERPACDPDAPEPPPCEGPDAGPGCGDPRPRPCVIGDRRPECAPPVRPCTDGIICRCAGGNTPPGPITGLEVLTHPDGRESHHHARLRFVAPTDDDGVAQYEVRVSREPIDGAEGFARALPAKAPTLDSMALVVPTSSPPGALVEVDFGGLEPQTRYHVGVRALDACAAASPIAVGEVQTTEIQFTVVSPCFVATAAYGSPLAAEIGVLRRFRDRHLRSHAPGRWLVAAYGEVGPPLACAIRARPAARAAARAVLAPIVAAARALLGGG
jgi:hypothetical protein